MRRSRHEGRPPGLAVHADSGGAGEVVELLLPPRPEAVSIARLVVGAVVAGEPAFDEDRAADLRLAVSEACTNAIQAQGHGAEAGADLPVAVRCTVADEVVVVEVRDHGEGFDPDGLSPHPEVTDPARLEYEGGLGIPLIRLLADELVFRPEGDGTTVVMRFGPRARAGRIVG